MARNALAVILLLSVLNALAEPPAPGLDEAAGSQIAFSLRGATEASRAPDSAAWRDASTLAGIGWIEGYVLDPAERDVILVGRRDPRRPHLHLDDVVASLRSLWRRAPHPYCSLDPKPEDVLALQRVLSAPTPKQYPGDLGTLANRVRAVWGGQQVVVGGVPRTSRFAHVMIDADYHMKQVGQGLARVPRVPSLIDRGLDEARAAVRAGGEPPPPTASMSRFWFHFADGHPTYRKAKDILFLDQASVVVLTERQRASADGVLHDTPGDDPHANQFARDFSLSYSEVAPAEPIYADLENLFRLYGTLAALHHFRGPQRAGLDLSFLLKRYQYQVARSMPDELPGLVNSKEAQESIQAGNMIHQYTFFPLVVGGVSMEVAVHPRRIRLDCTGELVRLAPVVLAGRPEPRAVWWILSG